MTHDRNIINFAALLLLCIALPLGRPARASEASPEEWIISEYAATCETTGYIMRQHAETGIIEIEDTSPATGHAYSDWIRIQDPALQRTCLYCGATETMTLPTLDTLPSVSLQGSMQGISKNDRVLLRSVLQDGENESTCYAYISWQGHTTLTNAKKNYTVRFFRDKALTDKYRMVLRPGWQEEHKYVLKANYADPTHIRNLFAAQVWARMAACRDHLHPRLQETSCFGAVDGFPVTIWLNGEFHGLYTLNLHKDDDLYAMGSKRYDAIMICNAQTMAESLFRAPAVFQEGRSDWELEYCRDEDAFWIQNHFNNLIRFVMGADDETFRSGLHQHLDVDAAIDYLLFMYAMGLTDSAAKDLIFLSYAGGPWIASAYDMEDALGLSADGTSALPPDDFLPACTNGMWDSATDSLLWDRLLQCFEPQIRTRWQALRDSVLAEDQLSELLKTHLLSVPAEAVAMDQALYPRTTLLTDPETQMMTYMHSRLPLLDHLFGGNET